VLCKQLNTDGDTPTTHSAHLSFVPPPSPATMVNQHITNGTYAIAMCLCRLRRPEIDDEYIARICDISLSSLAQAKRRLHLTGSSAKAAVLG
jgi:hypothetical protein